MIVLLLALAMPVWSAHDRPFWLSIVKSSYTVPPGEKPFDLLMEMDALLGSPDPVLRDDVAYGAQVVTIADGVYAILHPDANANWPNGNTTIVVGTRSVLVVDSNYLPSAARDDIEIIRSLTSKPVQFLVNTHWHYDHNNGNAEYRKAFPLVRIVAHRETRRLMDTNSRRHAAVAPDLAGFEYEPPDTSFETALTIDLGGREVRVANFGRGNTPGDAVVFLPAEKVLVTGDLVVAPVPYCYNSYPIEWLTVLEKLKALRAATIVPGHGSVQHDYRYIDRVSALLQHVVTEVGRSSGRSADAIRKDVDLTRFREEFAAGDAKRGELFDDSVGKALIERTLLAVRGGA
jgi:cyclase